MLWTIATNQNDPTTPVTMAGLLNEEYGRLKDRVSISKVILATLHYVSKGSTLKHFNDIIESFRSLGATKWLAMQLEHQSESSIASVGMTEGKGDVQYKGLVANDYTFKPLLIRRKSCCHSSFTTLLIWCTFRRRICSKQ